MAIELFKSYRAKQLGRVGTIDDSPIKLKVIGHAGTESKWLDITDTELEKIIAVLEPEDYKQATEGIERVELPTFDKVETVSVWYAITEDGKKSVNVSTAREALEVKDNSRGSFSEYVDIVENRRVVRYDPTKMDRKARSWVQEQYENVSLSHWTMEDYWGFIKEDFEGGRDGFLIMFADHEQ